MISYTSNHLFFGVALNTPT